MTANCFEISEDGVFLTVQGEGILLGIPMVFIRLSGCSVKCVGCDTNYKYSSTISSSDLIKNVCSRLSGVEWVWITGGEPADQDIRSLVSSMQLLAKVAVATSGIKELPIRPDFISVSPHFHPEKLRQIAGDQINLVPGLGGLDLSEWKRFDFSGFKHRFVTPLFGNKQSLESCIEFMKFNREFRLGVQAHKQWQIR